MKTKKTATSQNSTELDLYHVQPESMQWTVQTCSDIGLQFQWCGMQALQHTYQLVSMHVCEILRRLNPNPRSHIALERHEEFQLLCESL